MGLSNFPQYRVGVNLGFAVNRYPSPDEWIDAVQQIGVTSVQFVADLLNPSLPLNYRKKKVKRTFELCQQHGIRIESAFTGAYTRVNHFGSPDAELRQYWEDWFVLYAEQMSEFGVTTLGGHPGILSIRDDSSEETRARQIQTIIYSWTRVLERTEKYGIRNICWEPMSVRRELGHTLKDASEIQQLMETIAPGKFLICLDLDHGDMTSNLADDTNPIRWIEKFAPYIGMLHLKQTSKDRRKNMSFTTENNKTGTVNAPEIIKSLLDNGVTSKNLYLELGFRERNPDDLSAISEYSQSVDYWLKSGATI